MEVYIARQPIFKKNKKIYGYELLFRNSMSNFFPDIDGDTATYQLLANSFFSIGIEKIVGRKMAFINFTQDLLLKKIPLMFPKDRVIVEILEDVKPTDEIVTACSEIAHEGYHIALDDFFYNAELEPLIAIANTIKFDLRLIPVEDTADIIKDLSNRNINFLAEKVETYDEFNKAVEMGYEYFQGYFFSKPEIIKGKDISVAQMNLLGIMAEANKKDFQFRKLEKIIAQDVAISYKLLRYINSAYYRRVNEVSSIKQAIALLGENGVRRFVSLMAMAGLSPEKPDALIKSSVTRARFCELIGKLNKSYADPAELFTLGLFSMLDAILDDSMENLIGKLPLSEKITQALISGEGELVDYLKLAVSYETGDWDGVSKTTGVLGLDEKDLPDIFMDVLAWADNLTTL